jgi:hypothetical protein
MLPLFELIHQGGNFLLKDMERDSGYAVTRGYEAKNAYFNRANNLCMNPETGFWDKPIKVPLNSSTILELPQWDAVKQYYEAMRVLVEKYEQETEKLFNKGMLYANLGVAMIVSGHRESGIFYMMAADQEDQDFINGKIDRSVVYGGLWTQFESPHFQGWIPGALADATEFPVQPTEAQCTNLLERIKSSEERLFLSSAIMQVHQHLVKAQEGNSFSISEVFSGLRDLCTLVEHRVRRMLSVEGMMKGLLEAFLKKYRSATSFSLKGSNSTDCATTAININTALQLSPEDRSLNVLYVLRNFTSHQLVIDPTDPQRSSLVVLAEKCLQHIIAALFYLDSLHSIF